MKTVFLAMLLISFWIIPAQAADTTTPSPRLTVGQKRAEMLEKLNEKIARVQQEMACVQAASSHGELKACREKFRPEQKEERRHGKS